MLTGANPQVYILKHNALAARHIHMAQFQKLLFLSFHCRRRIVMLAVHQ